MLIGQKAPNFKSQAVVNGEIKTISLDDYKDKYKVLFFYPLDFTFICPTELIAFQDNLNDFDSKDCVTIGVSVDSVYSHLAWLNTPREKGGIEGVTYPLVSDLTKEISKSYDVLKEDEGIAYRAVFILNKENIVQSIYVNNLSIGRSTKEILRLIDALKFTEDKGQVCPANWKKGESGINLPS